MAHENFGKTLIEFKVGVFLFAFLSYVAFIGSSSISWNLILAMLLVISYNFLIYFTWNHNLLQRSRYLIIFGEIVLFGYLMLSSQGNAYFQPLFYLVITTYAIRFGARFGLLTALTGWLAVIVTGISQEGDLPLLLSKPETGILQGSIWALIGWFVGKIMESRHKLQESYQKLTTIMKIDHITGVYSYRYIQQFLAEEILKARQKHEQLSIIRISIDGFQPIVDGYGQEVTQQILKTVGELIQENIRGKDKVGRYGEDEFIVLLPGSDSFDALDVGEKIRIAVRNHSYPFEDEKLRITVSLGIATFPKDAEDMDNLLYRANQTLFRARHLRRDRVCLSSITIDEVQNKIKKAGTALAENIPTLVALIDAKDVNTCGHSERVTKYAVAMARKLGFTEKELERLQYGALLHDIGKINVEEHILDKPGSLNEDEIYSIRNHPAFGANFLASIDYLQMVTPLVLYHHERWDGSGYPEGLKGEEIPLGARIIAIADSYDAMVSERPYKKPLQPAAAWDEIKNCAGTCFDPALVEVFCQVVERETGQIKPA